MSFGVRSLSYNAVPQFQKRPKPADEPMFGKKPFRGTKEEEEEQEKLKKAAEFRRFAAAKMPNLHFMA